MTTISEAVTFKSNELRATSLVILSAVLYGFLGYFGASLINYDFSIPAMLFWRFAIATVCMLISLMGSKKSRFSISKMQLSTLKVLFLSSLSYCTACSFYFVASKSLGTGIAMTIYFAYPIFVVFLYMLKKRSWIDLRTFIALLIMLAGLLLLRDHQAGQHTDKLGILCGLAAAFFFGYYVYLSKEISNHLPSSLLTLLLCGSNTLFFLTFTLAQHSFTVPSSVDVWLYACGLGIIATALPVLLMLEALKSVPAVKASILSALEPVVTLFAGVFLLGETVSQLQVVGAAIILYAAIHVQFGKR